MNWRKSNKQRRKHTYMHVPGKTVTLSRWRLPCSVVIWMCFGGSPKISKSTTIRAWKKRITRFMWPHLGMWAEISYPKLCCSWQQCLPLKLLRCHIIQSCFSNLLAFFTTFGLSLSLTRPETLSAVETSVGIHIQSFSTADRNYSSIIYYLDYIQHLPHSDSCKPSFSFIQKTQSQHHHHELPDYCNMFKTNIKL